MSNAGLITLSLYPSNFDPPVSSREYQDELLKFGRMLRAAGMDASQDWITFDSANTPGHGLPKFLLKTAKIVIPVLAAALGAWIRQHGPIRAKIGEVEVQANTPAQVEQVLESIQKFQQSKQDDGEPRK